MHSFRCVHTLALLFCLVPLTQSALPGYSQTVSPQSRVVRPVDQALRVTLRGNVHPLAVAANDRGEAPGTMRADRMLLLLSRSAQQEAQLQTYLQAVQDPNSPGYHQWLTPAEFAARFGVSDADLAAVKSWLAQNGLTVNRVSAGRLAIEFSGTFSQVEQAFHTSIHSYQVNGEQHWANATDPQIPAALAAVVAGPVALHNFAPRSTAVRGPSGKFNAEESGARPMLTSGDATNGYLLYVGPADAATIYDTPTSLNANHSGTLYDGTGVTIGVAGDSNIDTTQNANFRATFGLPALATKVVVDGNDPGENGDAVEAYLDTEVAAGIAPRANVVLYTSADTYLNAGLFLAIMRAIDDNQVDILNVSFGACELALGASGNQYIYDLWQQAAAQGISVTVSSGDSGSAGCDNPNAEGFAKYGLAVNGIGSTPYNISVGGTDFDTLYSSFPSSFTRYVDVTNSKANHRSALSYIPGEPWNDSTIKNGLISGNVSWNTTQYSSLENIIAGGGGVSACVTQSGSSCSAGYAVPVWQSGFAADKSGRNLPDVSFLAGNGLYGATWALCTDQDYTSATAKQADCVGTPTTGGNFNVTGVGGTSAAAPAFAGMLALVAQKTGGRLGQADQVLYPLAKSASSAFHDITTGNNSVACSSAGLDCITAGQGTLFLSGFNTTTGYDEASGLGSVDVSKLVSGWGTSGATATTSSLTLNGGTSAISITHGDAVSAAMTISGSGGTPSGAVALVDTINPATLPNSGAIGAFALSGGAASASVNSLPGGSYKVSAHYGGDQTFAASDSNAIAVTVSPESSSVDLHVQAVYDPATGHSSSTPYYGFIFLVDAQPYGNSASAASPDGAATGTVTFTSGSTTLGTAPLGSDGIAELPTFQLAGGSNALQASFPGDASFKASTSATVNYTVQPALSRLNLSSDKTAYNAGDSVVLKATFGSASSSSFLDSLGAAPTGTVTFYADNKQIGTGTVSGTAGSTSSLAAASASATIKNLAYGVRSITATYSGDANYATSTSSDYFSVNIAGATTKPSLVPASPSIKSNESLLLTVTLPASGTLPKPTGTVTFLAMSTGRIWSASNVAVSDGTASATIPANTLPLGQITLMVQYWGDDVYVGNSASVPEQVNSSGTVTPTVVLNLPTTPVISAHAAVHVSGPAGDPVPTGQVTISGMASLTLAGGSATFIYWTNNPGPNTVTATYLGDSTYTSGQATGTVTLMGTPNLSFNPNRPDADPQEPLSMTVTVNQITNLPVPTGTITLTYGSYSSAATALVSGAATITIPAGTLKPGVDTVTAAYSGDTYYVSASGANVVNVVSAPPGISLTGTNLTITAGATTKNTSTISITPAGGFTGPVTLAAQIASGPTSATDLPTFSFGATNPATITSSSGAVTATLTVTTTASSSASLSRPAGLNGWYAGGGSVLACVLLLIAPAWRRAWRTLLGCTLLALSLVAGVSACGGGSSGGSSGGGGGGGGGGSNGTTRGVYTVTITGTSASGGATTTITVTVN